MARAHADFSCTYLLGAPSTFIVIKQLLCVQTEEINVFPRKQLGKELQTEKQWTHIFMRLWAKINKFVSLGTQIEA